MAANPWRLSRPADPYARVLADRHYSRQHPGAREFTAPGQKIVLVIPRSFWPYQIAALWVWHRPFPGKAKRYDGYDGFYNCAMFRNEGAGLSSELIKAAIPWVIDQWGEPAEGFDTYVWPAKIASTNPGYCYQVAGWRKDGWSKDGLKRRLYLPLSARPGDAAEREG